ncbi:MAG: hypothetical protein PQJ61_11525 [Spirochaetales bacterium]|uniref:Uncharacterized protein n=1 Tax=Candidatus Thalassospirochaeta sargassi TaxID=3119039 RepID=A0AAJ1IG39_9SPIO|nr:hypothetical protein [Spirochaetales bacterium]
MENKERQIKDLEKRIRLSESALSLHFEKIGEIILAADDEKKEASLTAGLLKQIHNLDSAIKTERKRIDNILSAVERADEIEALRKSLTQKIRSIEKDNVSNYETIGRASYEAYKDGELPADKYSGIFAEIVKIMLKIDQAEDERDRLNKVKSDSKFFDRVKAGARSLYLKNAVSSYYLQLQRQYKRAGEQICHSELVMNLEAESVENALKPFKENLEGIEKLEKEDEKLTSETEKLQGSLEGLGVESNPVKTVNEIENQINLHYEHRMRLQREAGEMVSLNRKDVLAKPSAVKAILKDIDKENTEIAEMQELVKRYKAELEIERQNQEINELNKKINGFEEKISNYSIEADQLKEKIQAAEENIRKLEEASNNSEDEND